MFDSCLPLSLPLLLLFAAKCVNTEHLLAWEHLLQLRGNFFDTPLFSLFLNFIQLTNIENHSLLQSSHYDSIFYQGKKKRMVASKDANYTRVGTLNFFHSLTFSYNCASIQIQYILR